jgi:replication factor A1
MKISDLKINQGNVEVEGVISELGDTRAFNKYGRELKVANAILKDDSGSIKLTLWNDDVTRFSEGDRIKIVSGYVSEFQGEKQLTSGKFGRMEKVVGDAPSEPKDSGDSGKSVDSGVKIKEEVEKELTDVKAKAKKAIVSKRDLKKKNEEDIDVYSEEVDSEPAEEETSEEDLF